jgi:acyl-homoserine lactone acylase PvdQ
VSAQDVVVGRNDHGHVRGVFAAGQGRQLNGPEGLRAIAQPGWAPPSFTSQLRLFTARIAAAPNLSDADVVRLHRDERFGVPTADIAREDRPRAGVRIVRDRAHEIPRVYGDTRDDVFFGSGYAQGQDRLFHIDVTRHLYRGRVGELVGYQIGYPLDEATMRGENGVVPSEPELRRAFDSLATRFGAQGAQIQRDIRSYLEGLNAYLGEATADPSRLPAEYEGLVRLPRPFTETDVIGMASLSSIFSAAGAELERAEQLVRLVGRLGARAGRGAWEDLLRRDDPESPATVKRRLNVVSRRPADPRAVAMPDVGSVRIRDPAAAAPQPSGSLTMLGRAWRAAFAALRAPRAKSYAVLVGTRGSASGHPLFVGGGQSQYFAPHVVLMDLELHGPGIDMSGRTSVGQPYVASEGHGPDFFFTITDAELDGVDTFAERLCEPDGRAPTRASPHYLYKGACRPFEVREVRYVTHPNVVDATPPRAVTLRQVLSVHGPVRATGTVDGAPVAFAAAENARVTKLTGALVANERANSGAITDARSFIDAFSHEDASELYFYADDRDIAVISATRMPIRARGTDPALPTWGTGEWDWAGFEEGSGHTAARRRRPAAISPREGYITGWNGRSAPGYLQGDRDGFGSVQRVDLYEQPLRRALRGRRKLDLTSLVRLVALAQTQDLRGVEVLPWVRRVIGRRPTGSARLDDALTRLDRWMRAGAHRRDLDGDNRYEHGDAVALLDAWWPRLLRAVFEPTFGKEVMDPLIADAIRGATDGRFGSKFFGGADLMSLLDKDLRTLLRKRVRGRLSRRYCGGGDRRACRDQMLQSLRDADDALSRERGRDPSGWTVPATCPVRTPPACDQIIFQQGGLVALPPIPFQNRATHEMLGSFTGHRPR